VIGGEESYGLMIGDQLRDKDAVSAVALLCEMAAYEKEKGRSLFDKLLDLYVQFGYFQEHLISITKKGMNGQQEIADMMEGFRRNPPASLNDTPVAQLLDYQLKKGRNLQTGEEWDIKLPASNVLQFILADGSKISARPSGTEPKIKFYFSVNTQLKNANSFPEAQAAAKSKIDGIIKSLSL
jgi:phosphoglucomutase